MHGQLRFSDRLYLKTITIRHIRPLLAMFVAVFASNASLTAQVQTTEGVPLELPAVVATVGDVEISGARVARHVERLCGNLQPDDEQLAGLLRAATEQLVKREIVDDFLVLRGFKVGENQIRLKVEMLEAQLARIDKSLEDFLEEQGRTSAELEHEFALNIRWKNYLDRRLTDGTLQEHFDRNRKTFDGTEIRVAQILFESDEIHANETPVSEEELTDAFLPAWKVREQIESGELSWADAVEQHSIAPSKSEAGDIGWIQATGPMPPEFTAVAFDLNEGELGNPFASSFGIHLIKCLEVRPGSAELGDVRDEVVKAVSTEFFHRIADRHQTEIDFRYADGWSPRTPDDN